MLSFLLSITDDDNKEKIEFLFNSYYEDMLRFAGSLLKKRLKSASVFDAEEVVSNTFLKLVKYAKSLNIDDDPSRIKNYVFTILANECNDYCSQNEIVIDEDMDVDSCLIDEEEFFERLRIKERYQSVCNAIQRMDYKYAVVLYFRFFENMEIEEIAKLLAIAEKTVYTRIQRGRFILLNLLEEEERANE